MTRRLPRVPPAGDHGRRAGGQLGAALGQCDRLHGGAERQGAAHPDDGHIKVVGAVRVALVLLDVAHRARQATAVAGGRAGPDADGRALRAERAVGGGQHVLGADEGAAAAMRPVVGDGHLPGKVLDGGDGAADDAGAIGGRGGCGARCGDDGRLVADGGGSMEGRGGGGF